jgi:AraC-like DNA-binding protein
MKMEAFKMEQWEQVNAVQNMLDYIRQHLNEPITLKELSRQAGYSPFHSAKLFKEHVGKAPFEYIRTLRLSQAALKLRDEKVRVLDVAMDFVFDSHEGFTRAFSKEFGITPHKYSKNPPPIKLFMPVSVRDEYLFFQRGGVSMERKSTGLTMSTVFVQVIERPGRKLILKRGKNARDYFEYCQEVDCDIWGLLLSVKEALYEPAGLWLPDRFRPAGTSRYVQGVEVPADYDGTVPVGLEIIDLPACSMMVFQGPPFENDDFFDAIADLMDLIDGYQPELYGYRWADGDAPRFQLEPQPYRGYIEARPVRHI